MVAGQRAYCEREHPGGDAEADRWCEAYHRPTLPAPLTADNWQERARAVETGDAPSGSLVVALTGPASVSDPALGYRGVLLGGHAIHCVSGDGRTLCGREARPDVPHVPIKVAGDVTCGRCRRSIRLLLLA